MSKRFAWCVLLMTAALTGGPTCAFADFMYDEDISGDFSNDRFAPTSLAVAGVGVNTVAGRTSRVAGIVDLDYFTVTIPVGLQLDSLVQTSYSGDGTSFIGVQAGTIFTEAPTSADIANLLGWAHFGTLQFLIGEDILPTMLSQGGSMPGIMPPLPSGTYTFWVQETGTTIAKYTLTFNFSESISAVPEPSSLCLACLGALSGLTYAARRRRGNTAVSLP